MRLDRHVLYVRNIEAVVKDAVRFGKRLVGIALAQHVVVRNVRALLRIEDRRDLVGVQIGMDQRRVRLHAFERVEHGGKLLVFDLDEAARLLGDLLGFRRDRRDRLAAELCGADGEEVLILEIQTAALLVVVARDDAAHTFQRLRLGGVDAENLGVRIRAALHLREQRTRKLNIVRKLRGAGDFFDGVKPFYGCTDYLHFS